VKVLNRWRLWGVEGDWKDWSFWIYFQRKPMAIHFFGLVFWFGSEPL